MEEKHLRGLWCDGIVPEHYSLEEDSPGIAGYAWMGAGLRTQEK